MPTSKIWNTTFHIASCQTVIENKELKCFVEPFFKGCLSFSFLILHVSKDWGPCVDRIREKPHTVQGKYLVGTDKIIA